MATPNYSYEKRQRELAKKRKAEEKRQRKLVRGTESAPADGSVTPERGQEPTPAPAPGDPIR